MTYDDDTVVEIGADHSTSRFFYFIMFANPRWNYKIDNSYNIKIQYNRGRSNWGGDAIGMQANKLHGVSVEDVKAKLVDEFAAMSSMRVIIAGRDYGSYNLSGTRNGLDRLLSCVDDVEKGKIDLNQIAGDYSSDDSNGAPQDNKPQTPPTTASTPDQKEQPKPKEDLYSTGTGFFVNGDGYLLTNAHVVHGCSDAMLKMSNSDYIPATIVARENNNDLAILKSRDKVSNFVKFRGQPQIRMGDPIVVFGYPLTGTLSSTGNFTTGLVSSLAGAADDVTKIQISAPLQSGNSGGPVADLTGHVVAIVVEKMDFKKRGGDEDSVEVVQNANFAIKAGVAQFFLDANQIHYDVEAPDAKMETADEAALMKNYSAQVICKVEQ